MHSSATSCRLQHCSRRLLGVPPCAYCCWQAWLSPAAYTVHRRCGRRRCRRWCHCRRGAAESRRRRAFQAAPLFAASLNSRDGPVVAQGSDRRGGVAARSGGRPEQPEGRSLLAHISALLAGFLTSRLCSTPSPTHPPPLPPTLRLMAACSLSRFTPRGCRHCLACHGLSCHSAAR